MLDNPITLILSLLLLIITLLIMKRAKKVSKIDAELSTIPHGPNPSWLFGGLVEWADSENLPHNSVKWVRSHGKVFSIRGGLLSFLGLVERKWIMASDFEIAKTIMMNETQKGPIMQLLKVSKQENIIVTDNVEWWKIERKRLNPSFTTTALNQLIPSINGEIDTAIKVLESQNPKRIEIDFFMTCLTLDIIGRVIHGKSFESLGKPTSDKLERIKLMNKIGMELITSISPWTRHKLSRQWNALQDTSAKICIASVNARIEEMKKLSASGADANYAFNDILSILIDPEGTGKYPQTKEELHGVAGEMSMLEAAGHDTTAHSLAFVLYLLASHPEVQQKLYNELTSKSSSQADLTPGVLSEIAYFNAVINEGLRMYPVVAGGSIRYTSKDYQFGNIKIPANTSVSMPFYAMARDAEFFPEPDKFNPDRWLNESTAKFPFSGLGFFGFAPGMRNCIGQNLARMELRMILSRLILKYKFSVSENAPKVEIALQLTLKPKNGIYLDYQARNE